MRRTPGQLRFSNSLRVAPGAKGAALAGIGDQVAVSTIARPRHALFSCPVMPYVKSGQFLLRAVLSRVKVAFLPTRGVRVDDFADALRACAHLNATSQTVVSALQARINAFLS